MGCVARQRRHGRIRGLPERNAAGEHDGQVVHVLKPNRGTTYKVGVDAFDAARNRSASRPSSPPRRPVWIRPGRPRQRTCTSRAGVRPASQLSGSRRLTTSAAGYSIYPRRGPDRRYARAHCLGRGSRLRLRPHDLGRSVRHGRKPFSPASVVGTTTTRADTSPHRRAERPQRSARAGRRSRSPGACGGHRGVVEYRLSVNDASMRTTTATAATFTGPACGRSYVASSYAADAAGNVSPSATVIAPQPSAPQPAAAATTQAPTTPSSLARLGDPTSVTLSWKLSTDNVGVAGYGIYRGNRPVSMPQPRTGS